MSFFTQERDGAIPVYLVSTSRKDNSLSALPEKERQFAQSVGFSGGAGRLVPVAGDDGTLASVLYGIGTGADRFVVAGLPGGLESGTYALLGVAEGEEALSAFAWALGCYSFDRYKSESEDKELPKLFLPEGVEEDDSNIQVRGAYLARDLVNTPASDMGPEELANAARDLADTYGAKITVTLGDDLLKDRHFMIHAVGRASSRKPRLIDMVWGDEDDPKVTIVGKGVCFDSGGLNLKGGESMALMKKDMGGAGNVLGLALMIMAAKLKVRLRVLVPAVENAVGSDAFRPGDVLQSRKGLTVEIGNTDAEGRLVLGDALALASEEEPDLLLDMATLTGAARVALGPDLPPFYCDDEGFVSEVLTSSEEVNDPLWRMPLWGPYAANLNSSVADVNHIAQGGFAGSITAALFLQKFVTKKTTWAHFDIYAWNPKAKPGRKVGAADHAIRSVFDTLKKRYS